MAVNERKRLQTISDDYHTKMGAAAGKGLRHSRNFGITMALVGFVVGLQSGIVTALILTVVFALLSFFAFALITQKLDIYGTTRMQHEKDEIDRQITALRREGI